MVLSQYYFSNHSRIESQDGVVIWDLVSELKVSGTNPGLAMNLPGWPWAIHYNVPHRAAGVISEAKVHARYYLKFSAFGHKGLRRLIRGQSLFINLLFNFWSLTTAQSACICML